MIGGCGLPQPKHRTGPPRMLVGVSALAEVAQVKTAPAANKTANPTILIMTFLPPSLDGYYDIAETIFWIAAI
jgi:hypothetical protein